MRMSFMTGVSMVAAVVVAALLAGQYARAEQAKADSKAAPAFSLKDTHGKDHSLADYKGKWVVLEWINHGCPFVVKQYGSGNMPALQEKYREKGVVWLSVCSSAPGTQGYHEAAEWNTLNEQKGGKANAILIDADGTVGRAYGAKTTPHMYVINPDGVLVYQGAIDDNPRAKPDEIKDSHNYVTAVLDAAMAGKEVPVSQTKPYGCGVKYKN